MDQRARRIRQIIEEAALAGGRSRVVPLYPARLAHRPVLHRTCRWVLLSGLLLMLPALVSQDAGTGARSPAPTIAEAAASRGSGRGLWKFSALQADSEKEAVRVLLAGGDSAPRGQVGTPHGGFGGPPVY